MSRIFSIVLALGLFALAFWAYKKNEQDIEEKKQSALIFKDQLRKEQVVQLVLNRVDGVVFELVQKEEEWSVVRPVKDKASSQKVDELLNNILTQTIESIDIGSSNWAEYHLDPPFSILSLKDRDDKIWKVGVSGEPNFDQRYFLKKGEQLLLGASQWKTLSQLQADDYLSKRLVSSKQIRRPVKISFQTLSQNYVFYFKNQKWQWEKREFFPLDGVSVEKFLDVLTQEGIQDFSLEKKSAVSGQWKSPDLKLVVEQEQEKKTWELKLKKLKSGDSQVVVSDRDFVYGLDAHRTNQILDFDFRDHKAPFYWDSEKLSRVEVTSSGVNFVLKKSKEKDQEKWAWKVVQPKGFQVHSQKLTIFLDWLENLKALSYPSKREFKGEPVRILLKSDEDKVLLNLDIKVQKDKKKVYVQVGSQVMTLSFDLFQKAFQPSILKEIPAEKETN